MEKDSSVLQHIMLSDGCSETAQEVNRLLSEDHQIYPWKTNGNYSPSNYGRNGMIEGSPFNVDAIDFIGVLVQVRRMNSGEAVYFVVETNKKCQSDWMYIKRHDWSIFMRLIETQVKLSVNIWTDGKL